MKENDMDSLVENACRKALYGLRHGAQIPMGLAEAHAQDAIAEFHSRTGVCEGWLPAIDETRNETVYALPAFEDSGRTICRVSCLYRLSNPPDFGSRRALSPNSYGIGSSGLPGAASGLWIELAFPSPVDATGSLLAQCVFSRRDSQEIAPMYMDDALDGVCSKVLHELCSDTGKAWGDPRKAESEFFKWERSLAQARLLAMRGGVQRDAVMKPSMGWI
jgi:hypothetical protein